MKLPLLFYSCANSDNFPLSLKRIIDMEGRFSFYAFNGCRDVFIIDRQREEINLIVAATLDSYWGTSSERAGGWWDRHAGSFILLVIHAVQSSCPCKYMSLCNLAQLITHHFCLRRKWFCLQHLWWNCRHIAPPCCKQPVQIHHKLDLMKC